MTITVYGIPNCDTVKKARVWLGAHKIAHQFHDYKKSGIDAAHLKAWCKELGWERVLNRAGSTFRKLADADKADLDEAKAVVLMLAQPSMIKRPLVAYPRGLLIGFDADVWTKALARKSK